MAGAPIKAAEREVVLRLLGEGALNAAGIALALGNPWKEARAQAVLDALEREGRVYQPEPRIESSTVYYVSGA